MNQKIESEKFKDLLEQSYNWPAFYVYKFIVPTAQLAQLKELLLDYEGELTEKPSRKGNYTSVGLKIKRKSPDDVLIIYKKVSIIEGIVSL